MSENRIKGEKKDRKLILLILGAVLGVFLLIFGSVGLGNQQGDTQSGEASDPSLMDPKVYAEEVERQVVELCSSVRGAGTVRAVVTLKGGYRAVYATDSQNSGSGYKNSMVLVGSGSSEGAVLICYENPEIAGIGIVCSGGGSDEVKNQIISLVSATFHVGSNNIYVASGQVS